MGFSSFVTKNLSYCPDINKSYIMKNLILVTILLVVSTTCFAQLPDLIGEKATIKQLESSYRKYIVEDGSLLDVGSYDDMDNIYLNATIRGTFLNSKFELTTNRNGIVELIYYAYDAIQKDHFDFLKNTIIKVHGAKYSGVKDNATVYISTLFGVTRYIFFERDIRGMAYVAFVLK